MIISGETLRLASEIFKLFKESYAVNRIQPCSTEFNTLFLAFPFDT